MEEIDLNRLTNQFTKENVEKYILRCFKRWLKKVGLDEESIKYILEHTRIEIEVVDNGTSRT